MRLDSLAHFFTIVASIGTVGALVAGSYQFQKTQALAQETLQMEREAKAVELYIKFNELKESEVVGQVESKQEATYWRNNSLLSITESIANLTLGNLNWQETISWMLELQQPFLSGEQLNCKTYSDEFRRMLERTEGVQCIGS